jgi:hypothetical protein
VNINNGQSMIVHEDKYSAIRRIFNRTSTLSHGGAQPGDVRGARLGARIANAARPRPRRYA